MVETVRITKYRTSDGREFASQSEAVIHQRQVDLEAAIARLGLDTTYAGIVQALAKADDAASTALAELLNERRASVRG